MAMLWNSSSARFSSERYISVMSLLRADSISSFEEFGWKVMDGLLSP